MKSPATDIATILDDAGVGIIGDNIYVGSDQPPKPDLAIFIQRTGTTEVDSPNLGYEYPTVQVIVRAGKGGRQECDNKVQEVKDTLHGITSITINDSDYTYIFTMSGPMDLEQDEIMRPLTAINFMMLRRDVLFVKNNR